jgi:hypothetical protein
VDATAADAQAVAFLESELKSKVAVGQDDLDNLAQARAAAVQDAILKGTGIDPGRVFIVTAAPLPAAPQVRMQLALH